jgi:hypothetical protein
VTVNPRKKQGFFNCTQHLSTSVATCEKVGVSSHVLTFIRHRIIFLERRVQGPLHTCLCSNTHPHRCSQEPHSSTVCYNKLSRTACSVFSIKKIAPWSKVLEKLIVTELVRESPAFYGTWRFFTVFTRTHLLDLIMSQMNSKVCIFIVLWP